jgi:hypothetical protein
VATAVSDSQAADAATTSLRLPGPVLRLTLSVDGVLDYHHPYGSLEEREQFLHSAVEAFRALISSALTVVDRTTVPPGVSQTGTAVSQTVPAASEGGSEGDSRSSGWDDITV